MSLKLIENLKNKIHESYYTHFSKILNSCFDFFRNNKEIAELFSDFFGPM